MNIKQYVQIYSIVLILPQGKEFKLQEYSELRFEVETKATVQIEVSLKSIHTYLLLSNNSKYSIILYPLGGVGRTIKSKIDFLIKKKRSEKFSAKPLILLIHSNK